LIHFSGTTFHFSQDVKQKLIVQETLYRERYMNGWNYLSRRLIRKDTGHALQIAVFYGPVRASSGLFFAILAVQACTQVQTCTARNTANNLCFDCEQASTFTASFTFGF